MTLPIIFIIGLVMITIAFIVGVIIKMLKKRKGVKVNE